MHIILIQLRLNLPLQKIKQHHVILLLYQQTLKRQQSTHWQLQPQLSLQLINLNINLQVRLIHLSQLRKERVYLFQQQQNRRVLQSLFIVNLSQSLRQHAVQLVTHSVITQQIHLESYLALLRVLQR